jgi:uncharacterized protein with FMN-binding domain
MRRIVIALMGTVSGVVLLFSYHTSTRSAGDATAGTATTPSIESDGSATAPTPGSSSSQSPTSGSSATPSSSSTSSSSKPSGTFTGDEASTRWGTVQVEIMVKNGEITQSQAVEYPQGNGRDIEINNYALPELAQEVVQQQSANIDAISGATVTSDGYIQSLQSAIDQAHL